jgi:hypothetical protein
MPMPPMELDLRQNFEGLRQLESLNRLRELAPAARRVISNRIII